MRAWGWAAIGAGAVAIGAGIYFVSLDGQQKTCMRTAGPMENCPRTWTTRGQSIASISGGALAVVLGTALLVGRF